jgi:hypothetical protein
MCQSTHTGPYTRVVVEYRLVADRPWPRHGHRHRPWICHGRRSTRLTTPDRQALVYDLSSHVCGTHDKQLGVDDDTAGKQSPEWPKVSLHMLVQNNKFDCNFWKWTSWLAGWLAKCIFVTADRSVIHHSLWCNANQRMWPTKLPSKRKPAETTVPKWLRGQLYKFIKCL